MRILLPLLSLISVLHFGLMQAGEATNTVNAANPAAPRTLKDVEYAHPGLKSLLLDLTVPANPEKKKLPVIVFIHGGGWAAGSKDHNMARPMVAQGYAVASINYRFSQEAIFPACAFDCKAAIRWVRAHAEEYNFDADHIGVWGDSAGGHLSALLGTSGDVKELEGDLGNEKCSSRVQCVCDFFGPADFPNYGKDMFNGDEAKIAIAEKQANPITALFGGKKDGMVLASPVTHVTKDDPPFLMVHGDADPIVPLEQSKRLEKLLKEAGVPAELIVIPGGGHGGSGFGKGDVQKKILDFFNKYLKPAPAK